MPSKESHRTWHEIARHARMCPSPHNTQPYRLRIKNEHEAEVVFLPRRGLFIADPEGRFTWLTGGIFIEICTIAAHSLGYELEVKHDFSPMYPDGDYETPQVVATLHLHKSGEIEDLDAKLIFDRHTSRLPYDGREIPRSVIDEMRTEAVRLGHTFEVRTDPGSIKWVVELNKQALFHDMDDAKITRELIGWLRFSEREENLTHDGLSARCLTFNGPLMKSFFVNHRFWTLPIIRSIVGTVYGASMKGIGTIGWLRGPYVTNADWVHAGKVMFRLWLIVTKHGYYWHPYGSVITSEDARLNMLRYFGLGSEDDGKKMVWLLLRLGKSAPPPLSLRLPFEEIILCDS